nr:nucleotidyltransferase domain-containing protein [Phaeodactylibacter xiamenensis]
MDVIERVKQEVSKVAPENEVVLFGSRARGAHRAESDWDFLILLDQEELTKGEKEHLINLLYDLELDIGEAISTIIHTKQEWEDMSVTPLYSIIKEEGIRA